MRLLVYWYTDDAERLLMRRELIEAPQAEDICCIAWMTNGNFWKNYAIRKVDKERFEEELRKPPVEPKFPGAT